MTRRWLTPLSLLLAALLLAAAILLPPRLSILQDSGKIGVVHTEDISTAQVEFRYTLTSAQRIQLLSDPMYVDNTATPSSSEMTLDQAASMAQEELAVLVERGILPDVTYSLDESYSDEFCRVWSDNGDHVTCRGLQFCINPQEVLKGESVYRYVSSYLTILMDDETGKIYAVLYDLASEDRPEDFELNPIALITAWGDYLELGEPRSAIQDREPLPDYFNGDVLYSGEDGETVYFLSYEYTAFDLSVGFDSSFLRVGLSFAA